MKIPLLVLDEGVVELSVALKPATCIRERIRTISNTARELSLQSVPRLIPSNPNAMLTAGGGSGDAEGVILGVGAGVIDDVAVLVLVVSVLFSPD